MIPDLEDRLAAALAARADLIQPEDLRQLEPTTSRYRPRRSVALLAAASVVIAGAIAAALLTRDDEGRSEPAKPLPDGYVEVDRLTGDVDGDGREDLVRLTRRTDDRPLLVADLATDDQMSIQLNGGVPDLLGLTDVGLPGRAVVTRRASVSGSFALAVHGIDGGRLAYLPEQTGLARYEGLRQQGTGGRLGYALAPRLTTWRWSLPVAEEQTVDTVTWLVADGRLQRSFAGRRCWQQGASAPTECPEVTEAPAGYVARGSLSLDLDGDGTDDEVRLSKPHGDENHTSVIIATLSSGTTTGARLMFQPRPGPLRAIRLDSDGGPITALVVETEPPWGDPRHVFALLEGRLMEVAVGPEEPVNLSSLPEGEFRPTSAQVGSTLLSWNLHPDGHQGDIQEVAVYRYRIERDRLIPVKVGVRCVDPVNVEVPKPC